VVILGQKECHDREVVLAVQSHPSAFPGLARDWPRHALWGSRREGAFVRKTTNKVRRSQFASMAASAEEAGVPAGEEDEEDGAEAGATSDEEDLGLDDGTISGQLAHFLRTSGFDDKLFTFLHAEADTLEISPEGEEQVRPGRACLRVCVCACVRACACPSVRASVRRLACPLGSERASSRARARDASQDRGGARACRGTRAKTSIF